MSDNDRSPPSSVDIAKSRRAVGQSPKRPPLSGVVSGSEDDEVLGVQPPDPVDDAQPPLPKKPT